MSLPLEFHALLDRPSFVAARDGTIEATGFFNSRARTMPRPYGVERGCTIVQSAYFGAWHPQFGAV